MFKWLIKLVTNSCVCYIDMGGGGGGSAPQQQAAPAPSSQTVTSTSIPEYARPQVETLLGQAGALTDINQNPYQQYAGERTAGFTPLQQQAFQGIGAMQVTPQTAQGSALAGTAGLGGLLAGGQYAQQATDPNAMSAYMSPYMQNAVDVQKNQAILDYQRQIPSMKAAATNAGAFGGSRQAITEGMGQEALQRQLGQIQGMGTQQAFQNAQQAQQYGAGLNMQGLGLAGQAGATLGTLGQQQYGQNMGILAGQQQAGAQQQALAQQGLSNQYQDFLNQQNYPYKQLGFMSDILRGVPLTQQAQSVYSAPPNMMSQVGNLGIAGLAASKLMGSTP